MGSGIGDKRIAELSNTACVVTLESIRSNKVARDGTKMGSSDEHGRLQKLILLAALPHQLSAVPIMLMLYSHRIDNPHLLLAPL